MSFESDLKAFNDLVEKKATRQFRRIAIKAFTLVVRRTPVLTGTAKGNWRVSLDHVDTTFDFKSQDTDGSRTFSVGYGTLNEATLKNVIHIANSVPYILRLENGYSRQAPEGMVKPTVEELRRYASQ